MRVTVIYDNDAADGLESGHGFSCLIEDGISILFDTGDNGSSLIHNMGKLGIDPASIDMVVLSHDHWDHTGGLAGMLEEGREMKVALTESFSGEIKEKINSRAELLIIGKEGKKLSENVFSTGELKSTSAPNEQSLLLKTKRGILVITGCAHPGLKSILKKARREGKVFGIMGGFHGFSDYDELRDMGLIAPCHCTRHKARIMELFPAASREIKGGSVIEL